MFKTKGVVHIVGVDSRTGEKITDITKENIIPDESLSHLLDYGVSEGAYDGTSQHTFKAGIGLANSTITPSKSVSQVDGVFCIGYTPAAYPHITLVEATSADNAYLRIRQRFNFTGTARTYNTVLLIQPTTTPKLATYLFPTLENNNFAPETILARAYLKLSQTATQENFEYLDITYDIHLIPDTGGGFTSSPEFIRDLGGMTGGKNGVPRMGYLSSSIADAPANPKDYKDLCTNLHPNSSLINGTDTWDINSTAPVFFNHREKLTVDKDEAVGRVLNSGVQGSSYRFNTGYIIRPFQDTSVDNTPIQTVWKHSEGTAPAFAPPFFDPLFEPSGSGDVIPGGNWSGKFPLMMKLLITNTGNVGAAEYKLFARKFLTLVGNTWEEGIVVNPYWSHTSHFYEGAHGRSGEGFVDSQKFSDTKVVAYDRLGVTLIDFLTGAYRTWDEQNNTAVPGSTLPVTNIGQVVVVGAKIYVGCRNTGLWAIDTTLANFQVQRVFNTPCYGVSRAKDGVIYAVTTNKFCNSIDWQVPIPLSIPGVTDSNNWSAIKFLCTDEQSIKHNTFVCYNFSDTLDKGVWWNTDEVTTPAVTSYTNSSSTVPNDYFPINVTDIGVKNNFWIFLAREVNFDIRPVRCKILTFGTSDVISTTLTTYNSHTPNIPTITDGSYRGVCKPLFLDDGNLFWRSENSYLTPEHYTLSPAGVITEIESGAGSFPCAALNMGNNLIFAGTHLFYPYKNPEWTEYGWNGNSWVIGALGSKVTHASPQLLLEGITCYFANTSSGVAFVDTDFYTVPICKGILKDNATYLYLSFNLLAKPFVPRVDFPTGGVALSVPANTPRVVTIPRKNSDGEWLAMETQDETSFRIMLNGVEVDKSLIVFGTSNPLSGGVTINASSGVMTFGAESANKVISGYYSYVRQN